MTRRPSSEVRQTGIWYVPARGHRALPPVHALLLALTAVSLAGAAQAASRPNLILIFSEDQSIDTLEFMPNVQRLLVEQGVSFTEAVTPITACCPSRVSLLRGQYSHNHGVLTNSRPLGGYFVFHDSGMDQSTLATWLRAAGYRPAIMGKYVDGYAGVQEMSPGWKVWHVTLSGKFFGNVAEQKGGVVDYGNDEYTTDVLSKRARRFIRASVKKERPFFLYLAPHAAHKPARPAPRHRDLFAELVAPRPPSFNEPDVSDKPAVVRDRQPLDEAEIADIDHLWRNRIRSLQAVDEMVAAIVAQLEDLEQLDQTVIVYSSDSGYHLGQHRRRRGKGGPYEEDIRVPFIVRGVGTAGDVAEQLVLTTDLAPTFAELAGAEIPDWVDGRSLLPLLRPQGGEPLAWRKAVLLEKWKGPAAYRALRTVDEVYAEYVSGELELYDLATDPHQLDSRHGDEDPARLQGFADYLESLAGCEGAVCRELEQRGPPGPAAARTRPRGIGRPDAVAAEF